MFRSVCALLKIFNYEIKIAASFCCYSVICRHFVGEFNSWLFRNDFRFYIIIFSLLPRNCLHHRRSPSIELGTNEQKWLLFINARLSSSSSEWPSSKISNNLFITVHCKCMAYNVCWMDEWRWHQAKYEFKYSVNLHIKFLKSFGYSLLFSILL